MKFQADHSNTPLVHDFDGQQTRLLHSSGSANLYQGSLLLDAKTGQVQAWRPKNHADLQAADFEAIAAFAPQVVIFGSGEKLRFAPPAITRSLMAARIGMETMDNRAACRTFNVLSAEGRAVLLALLVEETSA
jgi:uncharacterized protein